MTFDDVMENRSYLYVSHRKRQKYTFRNMNKESSTDSNLSLDSLEKSFKRKAKIKHKLSEEKVDTILVPFYENDVLIKVPKDQKRGINLTKSYKCNEKGKKEWNQPSYLLNKERQKTQRPSYLEMFRKQLAPEFIDKKPDKHEICSLSAEFGDTERESIGDDGNNPATEFFNSEPYNEMYYEKLLNRDIQIYMGNCLEDDFPENLNLESANIRDENPENLRSISDVSPPRRVHRRATVGPTQIINLGGLGPDIEKIKPRLERARSLQRYSEKVRMENRLKIYKNVVQTCNDKKEGVQYLNRGNSGKDSRECNVYSTTSYLVNKTSSEKQCKVKNVFLKSKSADMQKNKEHILEKERCFKQQSITKRNESQKSESKNKIENKTETGRKSSAKGTLGFTISKNKSINTDEITVPPVHISFMVNVDGVCPSSALKTLEEKHRMYQEQVKGFMDNNV